MMGIKKKVVMFATSLVLIFPTPSLYAASSQEIRATEDTTIITTDAQDLVLSPEDQPITDQPEVILESRNDLSQPKQGTVVTIRDLSDTNQVVFQGTTDSTGTIKFKSSLSKEYIDKMPGEVVDAVYEAYFVSPEGELTRTVFSVPHMKNVSHLSLEDRKILEKKRQRNVVIKQKGIKSAKKNKDSENKNSKVLTLSSPAPGTVGWCDIIGGGYKSCIVDIKNYTSPTKIASINIASGEQVDFNFTSSANVRIEVGYARDFAPYSASGSVSLSTDRSTGVDYSFGGTCAYFGSTFTCNTTRNVYANYNYHYEQRKVYYNNVLQWTDQTLTPTSLAGTAPQTTYYSYESANGRSVSGVTSSSYGAWFAVYNNSSGSASTTKSYSSERTFSAALSVTTPTGTFSGAVTTAYVNSHSIKWSVPNVGNTTYYHYDNGSNGSSYYVTQ